MTTENSDQSLAERLEAVYPELAIVRERSRGEGVFLVGGAVRDLLLGRPRTDIDLVIEGDAASLATRLGAQVLAHERFSTAKARLGGHALDIATARTETYSHPGALPQVTPARIAEDLARRDFSINAMAISLHGEPNLIDPHAGEDDLASGVLRVLHSRSFVDDPTRALRAARYAARFDFELEPQTASLLRATDLETISADRRAAELLRVAGEERAVRALELAVGWGLLSPPTGALDRVRAVCKLLESSPWREFVDRPRTLIIALGGAPESVSELVKAAPGRPSEAVELAGRHSPVELALARAEGADWLDRYLDSWRSVGLEIDGGDLIAAGIAEGPALGRGLREALRRKLDGEIEGREQELAAALEACAG